MVALSFASCVPFSANHDDWGGPKGPAYFFARAAVLRRSRGRLVVGLRQIPRAGRNVSSDTPFSSSIPSRRTNGVRLPVLLPPAYAIIPSTLKTQSILLESRNKCDSVTTLVNGNTRQVARFFSPKVARTGRSGPPRTGEAEAI